MMLLNSQNRLYILALVFMLVIDLSLASADIILPSDLLISPKEALEYRGEAGYKNGPWVDLRILYNQALSSCSWKSTYLPNEVWMGYEASWTYNHHNPENCEAEVKVSTAAKFLWDFSTLKNMSKLHILIISGAGSLNAPLPQQYLEFYSNLEIEDVEMLLDYEDCCQQAVEKVRYMKKILDFYLTK